MKLREFIIGVPVPKSDWKELQKGQKLTVDGKAAVVIREAGQYPPVVRISDGKENWVERSVASLREGGAGVRRQGFFGERFGSYPTTS